MRLRRGCGCPILLLLIANIFFVVGSIISLIRGPSSEPVSATRLGSSLSLAVMAGNLIVCAILGIAALRGQALGQSVDDTSPTGDPSDEGTDSDGRQDEAD